MRERIHGYLSFDTRSPKGIPFRSISVALTCLYWRTVDQTCAFTLVLSQGSPVGLYVPVSSTTINPLLLLNFTLLTRKFDLYNGLSKPPTYSDLIENSCFKAVVTSVSTLPLASNPVLTGIAETAQFPPPEPTRIMYIEGLPFEADGSAGDWLAASVGVSVGIRVGVSLGSGVAVAVSVGGGCVLVTVGLAVLVAVCVDVTVGVWLGGTCVDVGGNAVAVGSGVGSGVAVVQADNSNNTDSTSIAATGR